MKIIIIDYWMYAWMIFCVIGLFWASGIVEVLIGLALSGLYYQAGTGITKRNNRDRIIAIVLLIVSGLGYLDILESAVSNTVQPQSALTASISTILLIISAFWLYTIFTKDVVAVFKSAGNA